MRTMGFRAKLAAWLLAAVAVPMAVGLGAESATWLHAYHFPAGETGQIAARDGYVYVLNSWSRGDGMLVFDARRPAAPAFVGSVPARGYVSACAISGNTLYAASSFSLMVVDISNPSSCRLVRNMLFGFPSGDVGRLAVAGNRLYLSGQSRGLCIMDISEPDAPVMVACHRNMGRITGLSASGNLLVIQSQGQDTMIATVEGAALTERARLKMRGSVRLVGKALYETDSGKTMIHDLTDPAAPTVKTNLAKVVAVGMLTATRMLAISPDRRFQVLDVSNPLVPVVRREGELPADVSLTSLALADDRLYVLDRARNSLRILDISTANARELSERSIMRYNGTVEIGDGYAFLCYGRDVNTTVFSVDLKHPGTIDFAGRVDQTPVTSSNAFDVASMFRAGAAKRIGAFLLTGDGVVDVADPVHPKVVRPMTRSAADIAVEKGMAYLAQGDCLTVLDVSALPEVSVAGTYRPEGEERRFTGVVVEQGVAYVVNAAKANPRIEVLDVKKPVQPVRLGLCAVPPALACALNGRYLYVPHEASGTDAARMAVVDVSDPRAPVVVKSVAGLVSTLCYRVCVQGDRLYHTDGMRGIGVADIRDPLQPVRVGAYTGPTDVGSSYMDFGIEDGKLYGQRYAHLDVWTLPAAGTSGGQQR